VLQHPGPRDVPAFGYVPDEEHCCAWWERSDRREEDKRSEAVEGEKGVYLAAEGFEVGHERWGRVESKLRRERSRFDTRIQFMNCQPRPGNMLCHVISGEVG
jgi:hypothetical protein